jgi:hypothetical protein
LLSASAPELIISVLLRSLRVTAIKRKQHDPINGNKELKVNARRVYVRRAVFLIRSWAVGREIRPGCLKVVAYVESKLLADALAQRLGDD